MYVIRYVYLNLNLNVMNIIITHANYKQISLIGYIIEMVSILRSIRVSVF